MPRWRSCSKILPDQHPLLGRGHIALAQSHMLAGQDHDAAADAAIEQALTLLEPAGNAYAAHLARALCLRAERNLHRGQHAQAAGDADRCLSLRNEYADPNSWEIAVAVILMTSAEAQAHSGPAPVRLRQAEQALARQLGSDHPIAAELRKTR